MRKRWPFLIILMVFIVGIVLSIRVIDKQEIVDVDLVALNETVKKVEQTWGGFEQASYSSIEQPITILDNDGAILYQTDSGFPKTISAAIKSRDTIVDIMQQGSAVGTLIVHNEDKHIVQQMKEQLLLVLVLTFAGLAILSIAYILYLNHKVFKPFNKLQSFAMHIAKGNLDIPLQMDENNLFGAFTESFDIMREELAAARQSEYESNRSKKELVATLSHDIKTPIASIKAVSELMLLRATDEKTMKQLNTIYSKAEQVNLLVTDMFHATLEELSELKVVVTEEPSTILSEMIANINFDDQIHCEPIPQCIILTDAARLQQVLDNIISNSYKYAQTPITITSKVVQTHLELNVMDYGKGMSEEEIPLLFNKYYRGSNVEGQAGSGLGLYISQYFMNHMQGDISCHNREDGFTVTLSIKLA